MDRRRAAELLLEWAETTHGNEFGHDHHCPLDSFPERGPWAALPGDPEKCTCGWSAFRVAYDAAQTVVDSSGDSQEDAEAQQPGHDGRPEDGGD